MAATVLSSPRAVKMSLFIIRAFVKIREDLAANAAILKRLAEIDRTLLVHDVTAQAADAREGPRRNGRLECWTGGVMGEGLGNGDGRDRSFHHGWDRMDTDADFSDEANEENEEDSSSRTTGNTRTDTSLRIPGSPFCILPSPFPAMTYML
jgi:hypothetical protein